MKHAGTFATYQGIPCTAVRYRNARGARASVSEVEIPAPLLEASGGKPDQTQSGFRWSEWNAADLAAQARPQAPEGVDEAFAGAPRGALSLPRRLQWEGTLSLAEDPQRVLSIPGLAIVRIEKVDASANKAALAHFYRLTLVDWRFFLGRGAVTEWNFNVVRQDGTVRLDTTKAFPPGERYSLDEIAEVLRAGIWRHPEIARTPPAWDTNTREVTFLPFESMATALPKLCAYGEVVEPCLHIDGELAFYAPGEGMVGWAPEGKGENTEDLPDDHKAAEGLSWESAWPEEYVMVVGGPRVATVAVDDSEPVLMLDGVPALLTEQLVRNLTKNRYGLEWLAKIVMMPPSDHYVEGVPEATVKLLTEQAWNFYRVREAEKSEVGDYPDGSKGLRYTGEPGANAHLLPLLDRAGTAGGARRAVTVESYSWDVKKRRFRDATESGEQLASANQALAEIRQAVAKELRKRQSPRGNPLGQKNPPLATDSTVANLFRAEYRRGLPLDGMLGD
ncbi:MAG: hypothetical protein KDA21_15865, partial [Phycisphaerales bacterium]|nr:hypothetical protein [Phycisphaerales bacterium]